MRTGTRTRRIRIEPVAPHDWTPEIAALMGTVAVDGAGTLNLFNTLANHPRVFRHWLPFSGALLLRSSLTPRQRELLILRTAIRIDSPYEIAAHTRLAAEAGLIQEEIEALVSGGTHPSWSRIDLALVESADDLHADGVISDDVWEQLAAAFETRALVEIPLLIGAYVMLGYFLNSAGVVPDVDSVTLGYAEEEDDG